MWTLPAEIGKALSKGVKSPFDVCEKNRAQSLIIN
jgi:hypothetical protein